MISYKWQTLTLHFNEKLRDALSQQHHAAQLIALAGKYLIPQKADDSNTNMQYLPERQILIGNQLPNGFRLALTLTRLEIQLLGPAFDVKRILPLEGKNFPQAFEAVRELLDYSGIDTTRFKDKLHYEIPYHPVLESQSFNITGKKYFEENSYYRHNSEIVLNAIVANYRKAAPVRVWPHHFDTGTFIPLDESNISPGGSIGLGWAIPDSMVKEPYFYLSYWSESPSPIKKLPELPVGMWMIPEWNGAVLKHSEILNLKNARDQQQNTHLFLESGIEILSKTQ